MLASTHYGAHVLVGGLVIARQRPGTANGITFLLLEDEHGTLGSRTDWPRSRLRVRVALDRT